MDDGQLNYLTNLKGKKHLLVSCKIGTDKIHNLIMWCSCGTCSDDGMINDNKC